MKLRFTGSIRYLSTLIVACSLLPALGLILYSGYTDRLQAIEEAQADKARQVRAIAQQQRMVVESTRTLLLTLSHLEEVREQQIPALSILFQNLKLRYPAYVDLRLCDLQGRTLVSAAPEPEQLSEPEREELLRVLEAPVFTVQRFFTPGPDALPVLNCVFPVTDNGDIRSLLVASVRVTLPGPKTASLYNKNGHLLQIADNEGFVGHSSVSRGRGVQVNASDMQKIREAAEDSGLFTSTLNGTDALVVFDRLRLSSFSPPYLNVILAVEKERIFEPVRDLLKRNILLFALVTLFAFAVSWNFARIALITPINKLLAVANQLKNGDLTARVVLANVAREFEVLASSFNSMASVLEAKGRDLFNAGNAALLASKSKSEFLANMSHEIRTPMNAILGMTYLAQRTPLTERQQNYINKIHSEATRLLTVINDILDFSKIEAGKLNIEQAPFPVRESLANFLAPLEDAATKKHLEFKKHIDASLPSILMGDSFHLGQILTTLIGNAIKYTDSGEIRISCAALPSEDTTVTLAFTITDTGPGFTKEQIDSFFPAEQTQEQSPTGGSGLSLVIARRLVLLMGGALSIESQEGRGTTISFELPLQKAAAFQVRSGDMTRELPSFRVLVVDPNESTREALTKELNGFSMQVATARSQEEALTLLGESGANTPFYLVMLDMQLLAYGDGTFPEHIKSLPMEVTPAVIVITRADRQDILLQAEKSGADILLNRPFDSSMLFNSLQEALVQSRFMGLGEEATVEEASLGTRDTLNGVRLLLVEDNIINQQIAEEILTNAGARVDVAKDGSVAVSMLREHLPDIPYHAVLMDLQMPVMDGFEATRQIRADMGITDLPIIAMTAHTMSDEWEQCAAVGINDYIGKPIEVDKLFSTLKKWIGSPLRPEKE